MPFEELESLLCTYYDPMVNDGEMIQYDICCDMLVSTPLILIWPITRLQGFDGA